MINRFLTGVFQSNIPRVRGLLATVVFTVLFSLSGCVEEPSGQFKSNQSGGVSASFKLPEMLVQSREIDQNELSLSVTVDGNEYAPDTIEDFTQSIAIPSIQIPSGKEVSIVVTWYENYKNIRLPLAQVADEKTFDEDTSTFRITTASYFTGFDYDDDRISNLKERNDRTDPTVAEVMENPIVFVPIRFRANLPERLIGVDGAIDDSLSAVAIVDRIPIQLNREGDTWEGQVEKPANTEVQVEYNFFSSISANAKLANWIGRVDSTGLGTTIEISQGEYTYEFNSDGDGRTNLEEIIQGTNPEDKNDPKPNPCDNSKFDRGCNVDTDGDGDPDSVETESADQDGDSIPDYQESMNDDKDDDGFHAEIDRDENDPCVPNPDAIACDPSNSEQPPVSDPPADDPPADDPPPVDQPTESSPLSYDYYEGEFDNMPNFDQMDVERTGMAATFAIPSSIDEERYALRFTGKLFIAEAGEYTFFTESSDGSLLYIDGSVIVNNDGSHELVEQSGALALTAGLHDIVLEYFQNTGSEELIVSWSSSDIDKQVIPDAVLSAP